MTEIRLKSKQERGPTQEKCQILDSAGEMSHCNIQGAISPLRELCIRSLSGIPAEVSR